MKIRNACKEDAQQLIAIYASYVEKTAITFEYQVPSLEEFEERIEKQSKNFLIWLQKKREFCKVMPMLQFIIIMQLMIGQLNYRSISKKKHGVSISAVNFMLV